MAEKIIKPAPRSHRYILLGLAHLAAKQLGWDDDFGQNSNAATPAKAPVKT